MKKINRNGETSINKYGTKMTIINYKDCNHLDIEFEDGYIINNTTYRVFQKGTISSIYDKTVYNIGYLGCNDKTKISNKHVPSYEYWHSMIRRCYDAEHMHYNPTYEGCTVCDEWLCYKNFKEWFDKNYYEVEEQRMALDKDILVKGNKFYSPTTCCIIPMCINSLFTKADKFRGELPIGVSFNKVYKKYSSICMEDGKSICLGYFDTIEESFNKYKVFKENLIEEMADRYKEFIPIKLYEAMYNWKVEITD